MGLLRPTSSVTLRRSVPSQEVYISDLQCWVCYPCRERILRQLAPEHLRSHPRRLGTASWSIFVIPVTAFSHSDGSLKLNCLICLFTHLFSYFYSDDLFWLTSMQWPAVHDTSSWLFSCLRTASSFWDNFSKSLFDNNNNLCNCSTNTCNSDIPNNMWGKNLWLNKGSVMFREMDPFIPRRRDSLLRLATVHIHNN